MNTRLKAYTNVFEKRNEKKFRHQKIIIGSVPALRTRNQLVKSIANLA